MCHALDVSESVSELLSRLIGSGQRGTQSDLARHVEVERQTVGKWRSGQTKPDPAHWSAIEEFFDLPENTIADAAGVLVRESDLAAQVADLERRLRRIEQLIIGRISDP